MNIITVLLIFLLLVGFLVSVGDFTDGHLCIYDKNHKCPYPRNKLRCYDCYHHKYDE